MAKPKIDPLEKIVACVFYTQRKNLYSKERIKFLQQIAQNAVNIQLANEKV